LRERIEVRETGMASFIIGGSTLAMTVARLLEIKFFMFDLHI
jgi:membrane carboxypeptidase/penicillin-binding protein PbpC